VIPSRVSDEVVFTDADDPVLYRTSLDGKTPPSRLPGTSANGGRFIATNWSPDGSALAGSMLSGTGRWAGVAVYDLRSQALTVLADDRTDGVNWLPDSRRLLYFTDNGTRLMMLDAATKKRTAVPVHLPGPSTDDVFGLSRDGRTIYYGALHAEADIWMAERK
jgi:Tol biopolymer transport system component